MYYVEFKDHRGKIEETLKFETIEELWDEIISWPMEDNYNYIIHKDKIELVTHGHVEFIKKDIELLKEFIWDAHFHDYQYAIIKNSLKV